MKGRTALQLRRYGRSALILLALMVIGSAAGFYILLQQRLPNPFQTFYSVNAQFTSAAAVVPGLGEPVNVAGVHVGEITGTSLSGGRGVLHMEIDPSKMMRLYGNASAALVANTPLKDMQVNIAPGNPSAGVLPHGATIPVSADDHPGRLRRSARLARRGHADLVHEPRDRAQQRNLRPGQGHSGAAHHTGPDCHPAAADR